MRIEILDVNDNLSFSSIYEALNVCMGTSYNGWMKACWPNVLGNGHFRVWFPKLAIKKDGEQVAASFDCLNVLSEDGKRITFDDLAERQTEDSVQYTGPDLIFAKDPSTNGKYVFRGVFITDVKESRPNHNVSVRIATRVRMIGKPAYDIELLDDIRENGVVKEDSDKPGMFSSWNRWVSDVLSGKIEPKKKQSKEVFPIIADTTFSDENADLDDEPEYYKTEEDEEDLEIEIEEDDVQISDQEDLTESNDSKKYQNISILELGLPTRIFFALKWNGINTISDLICRIEDKSLTSIQSIGEITQEQIEKSLEQFLYKDASALKENKTDSTSNDIDEIESNLNQIIMNAGSDELELFVKFRDIAIEELGITIRSFNALKRAGINTIYDLIKRFQEGSLKDIRNFGRKSQDEVKRRLSECFKGDLVVPDKFSEPEEEPYVVPDEIEKISLAEIQLSVRAYNVLMRAGCSTVGDFMRISDEKIREIRGAGRGIISQIQKEQAFIKEKGIRYFREKLTTRAEDRRMLPADSKELRTIDIVTVRTLCEEYHFRIGLLSDWYGLSKQRIYQIINNRVKKNKGNWVNRVYTPADDRILSAMLEQDNPEIELDGRLGYIFNNRCGDSAVIIVDDKEIKCFFLEMLPDNQKKKIRDLRLDELSETERELAEEGSYYSLLKEKYFIPARKQTYARYATLRGMSLEEYTIFLTNCKLSINTTVTDEKIIQLLETYRINGHIRVPNNHTTQWFRRFIIKHGYTVEDLVDLYGLYDSNEEPEEDLRETNSLMEAHSCEGDWIDEIFARNPLVGNVLIEEDKAEEILSSSKKIVDEYMTQRSRKLTIKEKMIVTLAIILYARNWDYEDGEKYWAYVPRQFGYIDKYQKLHPLFRECVEDAMSQNGRWFIESLKGKQQKATVMVHALAPMKTWLSLYDFLFRFYKENLNWIYIEGDPIISKMVESLRNLFIASEEKDEDDIKVGANIFYFQEGIRKLIIYQPEYSEKVLSHMISRIDAIMKHEEKPASCYLDQIGDLWMVRRNSISDGKKKPANNRGVVIDYSRIHPVYSVQNDRQIVLEYPDIRLTNTDFDKVMLDIYVGGELSESIALGTYGDELGKTIISHMIDVEKCVKYGDGSFHIRCIIRCGEDTIYDSGEDLYRDWFCFSEGREKDLRGIKKGAYLVFFPMSASISFFNAEVNDVDTDQLYQGFFVELEDDFAIKVNNEIVVYDMTATGHNTTIKVRLPRSNPDVKYQHGSMRCEILDGTEEVTVLIKEGEDKENCQIWMNQEVCVLDEIANEDNAAGEWVSYRFPIHWNEEDYSELRIVDLSSNRVVSKASFKKISNLIVRFNRDFYFSEDDYQNAFVRMHSRKGGIRQEFGMQDEVLYLPYADGKVEVKVPKISLHQNSGEIWNHNVRFYCKDIPQNDQIFVSRPKHCQIQMMLDEFPIPAATAGTFQFGEAVYVYTANENETWVNIRMDVTSGDIKQTYIVGNVAVNECFSGKVRFDYCDNKLFWNSGSGFVGENNPNLILRIRNENEKKDHPISIDQKLVLSDTDIPYGEYQYEILKISKGLFSSEEKVICRGTLYIGDENEVRFQNYIIAVTGVTSEENGEVRSVGISHTYIDHITYLGMQESTPIYSGIIYYQGLDGVRHEFSYKERDYNEMCRIAKINPVRIEYVNQRTISITNEDEDGFFYFRRYDHDLHMNVYSLTDREPLSRKIKNFYFSDLYLFRKEKKEYV